MRERMKNFFRYRFLLGELVKKGIKLKYRRSYLGILWSLLEPLLTTAVLTIVFGTLFGNDDATFPVYILSGRFWPWSFGYFQRCIFYGRLPVWRCCCCFLTELG